MAVLEGTVARGLGDKPPPPRLPSPRSDPLGAVNERSSRYDLGGFGPALAVLVPGWTARRGTSQGGHRPRQRRRLNIYTVDVDAFLEHYGALAQRLAAAGVAPPATLLGLSRLASRADGGAGSDGGGLTWPHPAVVPAGDTADLAVVVAPAVFAPAAVDGGRWPDR